MSNSTMNTSTSSSASYSYSYSSSSYSSTDGQQTQATRSVQTSHTDPSGNTTVQSAQQNLGEPVIQETRHYDAQGRELVGDSGPARIGSSGAPRIEDVSDGQLEADKLYEERIEDEYAKREGGA